MFSAAVSRNMTKLTMSMGPAKCGDPRVTNPVPSQEEEAGRERVSYKVCPHLLNVATATTREKKTSLGTDACL